ncbi:MAG: hypothetical protein HXS48_00770 [Theionarchaea archaeon]|jgi:hypothetical protein|nr:hypothetical protein [Theionarchaea archaeon]
MWRLLQFLEILPDDDPILIERNDVNLFTDIFSEDIKEETRRFKVKKIITRSWMKFVNDTINLPPAVKALIFIYTALGGIIGLVFLMRWLTGSSLSVL